MAEMIRTEEPFFQPKSYRPDDELMLWALRSWISEHPTSTRARALTMVVEARERIDG